MNRASNKLTRLAPHIYCCRSGSAADTQAVAEVAARYLREHAAAGGPCSVEAAAGLLQRVCYANRWGLLAGLIVAGFDPRRKQGAVYALPLGGSRVRAPVALGGSGSAFIYGWVDEHYRPNMSTAEAREFAIRAIAHAYSRDGSSGGLIRTITLSENGAEDQTIPWDQTVYCLEKNTNLTSTPLA